MRQLKRIDSSSIQGEGSYIEMRGIPYSLLREAGKRMELAPKDAKGNARMTFNDQDEHLQQVIRSAVVKWNWSDQDDKPIPVPTDPAFDMGLLTVEEIQFIYQAAVGQNGIAKN